MQEMIKRRAGEGGGGEEGRMGLMPKGSLKENGEGEGEGEGEGKKGEVLKVVAGHPYDFHVSGPRNLSSPNWRDLIRSSWFVFLLSRHVSTFLSHVFLLSLIR